MPARRFPHTISEYLDTHVNLVALPAGNQCTCAAWVKIDSAFGSSGHTIFGAQPAIGTLGFWFFVANPLGGGQISLYRGAIGVLLADSLLITSAGNFTDKPWFVAATIQTGVAVKFYAGLTPSTIIEIGTNLSGDAFAPFSDAPASDYTINIGRNHAATSTSTPMGGVIDQVALWYGHVLSLDQLKQFANCGGPVELTSIATFYYPITGDSPEPDLSPNGFHATVVGTTVVDDICLGGSGGAGPPPPPPDPPPPPPPPPGGGTTGSGGITPGVGGTANKSFELYSIAPIVLEELPQIFQGRTTSINLGHEGQKAISGVRVKACTLGQQRVFTFYLDGSLVSTTFPLTLTSNLNEPTTLTFNFGAEKIFTDIALNVDGEIELYEWIPTVLYKLPPPKLIWDTGYVDIGTQDLTWIREIKIKVRTPVDLTVQPFFDDTGFAAYTVPVGAYVSKTTIFDVPVGREYKGRQPRIVVSASNEFYPYYCEFYYRPTGMSMEKKAFRYQAI